MQLHYRAHGDDPLSLLRVGQGQREVDDPARHDRAHAQFHSRDATRPKEDRTWQREGVGTLACLSPPWP